jgi:hypothetical protein
MRSGDSLTDLIDRADQALYVSRGQRQSRR